VTGGHADTLAIYGAIVLALVGGIWKALGLRGDIYSRWHDRVDLAHAGLSDRALTTLVGLQKAISDLLGQPDAFAGPAAATIDPSPLAGRAETFTTLVSARNRLQTRLRRHLRLGPMLAGALVATLAGTILLAIFNGYLWRVHWFPVAGAALACPGVCLAVGCVSAYGYFEHCLSGAEILSTADDDRDDSVGDG
jgi:hypothetical protein